MISMIKIMPSSGKPMPPPSPPLPSPAPATQKIVIDAGSQKENKSFVAGDTWIFGKSDTPVIKGAVEASQTYFRTHRSSKGTLKYIVPGFTVGASYTLTMGFAKIWKPNCAKEGKQIMSIKLNGAIVTSKLDVFGKAGCETAYLESHVATPNANGQFVIEVIAFVENPMISYISITLAPGQYFLDAGAVGDDISMVTGKVSLYGNADSPFIDRTDLNQVPFRTNRFGADFKYVIDSGFTRGKAYKVALSFSEISPTACTAGKRKFSIASNGQTVENGLDVAGATGGV